MEMNSAWIPRPKGQVPLGRFCYVKCCQHPFLQSSTRAELWPDGDFCGSHSLPAQRQEVSDHLGVCMSWGVLEAPSWVHLGAPLLQGSQRQMGENLSGLVPGSEEGSPDSMGMGLPAKVRCRGCPRDHSPSQMEGAAVRSQAGSLMAVHVCV